MERSSARMLGTAEFRLGAGKVDVTVSSNADATIEQRVKLLEHNQLREKQYVRDIEKELREADSATLSQLQSESNARVEYEESQRELVLHGIKIEMIGLIWILAGVTYATVPDLVLAFLR